MKNFTAFLALIFIIGTLAQDAEEEEGIEPIKDTKPKNKKLKSPKDKDKGEGGGESGSGDGSPSKNTDWSGLDNLASVLYDLRDLKKDEEIVCKALKAAEPDMKININLPYNYAQMLQLLTWTLKHNLKSGKSLKFNGELEWKHEVVDLLSTIFKKGCKSVYIPEEYINILKELFMIYMNSIPPQKGKKEDPKGGKEGWKEILANLKICAGEIPPLVLESLMDEPDIVGVYVSNDISDTGDLYEKAGQKGEKGAKKKPKEGILYESGAKEEEIDNSIPIAVHALEEMADENEFLDPVIDNLWQMFSFAFGTCYPYMENKAEESAELKDMFIKHFLKDLEMRWREGGAPIEEFGPIFAEIESVDAQLNVRRCVSAAYTRSLLEDRQLVRPLELTGRNDSSPIFNERTGWEI